jgi:hypothetical protein
LPDRFIPDSENAKVFHETGSRLVIPLFCLPSASQRLQHRNSHCAIDIFIAISGCLTESLPEPISPCRQPVSDRLGIA